MGSRMSQQVPGSLTLGAKGVGQVTGCGLVLTWLGKSVRQVARAAAGLPAPPLTETPPGPEGTDGLHSPDG